MRKKMFMPAIAAVILFLGLQYGGIQFAMLQIADEFRLTSVQMGLLMSLFFAANTISPLAVGWLSDRTGKKPVLLIAVVINIGAGLVCIFCASITAVTAAVAVLGFVFGTIENSYTAALSDHDITMAGRNISIAQGIMSLACFAAPLLLQGSEQTFGATWRSLFCVSCSIAAVSVILLIPAPFRQADTDPQSVHSHGETGQDRQAQASETAHLRRKTFFAVLLMVLSVFVYMFMESGIGSFANAFVSKGAGLSHYAAWAVSLFWLGMGGCRIIVGFLHRYDKAIAMTCFGLLALLMILLPWIKVPGMLLVLYFLVGVICAPIWPFAAGRLNRGFPKNTGFVTSLVIVGGGAGSTVSPTVLGALARGDSYLLCYAALAAAAVVGLILSWSAYGRIAANRPENKDTE